jgi:iron complex transport system substrate-binding protein
MHIRRHCVFVCVFVAAAALVVSRSAARAADVPAQLPRIVSLSPHITELLFAAGAGGRIVGVDDASDYPPAAARITRLGEVDQLDIEGLLRLHPTLVIVWASGTPPKSNVELERLNLHLYLTEQRHLDDIATTLIEFGRLAGTLPVATQAARQFRADLADLRMHYAGRVRLKVFYQVWDRPLYTLSGTHVVSEVLSLCGGDNIFADLSTLAPAVDKEAVLSRDPDVILIGAAAEDGARQVREWNKYASLRAVQRHHVFTVDPSLTGRMSPRILQGVRQVCSFLDQSRLDRAGTS